MSSHDGELLLNVSLFVFKFCPRQLRQVFRRFVIEGREEDTIWKRFALLPYIEGQKYTIGGRFTSRMEQGEFIFLNNLSDNCSICEITVEGNKFFIKPLKEGRVWINDNEMQNGAKHEISFGDFLTLGKNEGIDPSGITNTRISYLFQKRELRPEEFLSRKNSQNDMFEEMVAPFPSSPMGPPQEALAVGQNSIVLSKIMSHLPIKTLKIIRLVSQTWNVEARRILEKRCPINFDFGGLSSTQGSCNGDMKLFLYDQEMSLPSGQIDDQIDSGWPNWRMTLPPIADVEEDGSPVSKLMSDLDHFILRRDFREDFHAVKKLELGGDLRSKTDFETRFKILALLQTTLEDLTLSGCIFLDHEEMFTVQFPCEFKRLKRFSIALSATTWEKDAKLETNPKLGWTHALFTAIRTVRWVDLNSIFYSTGRFPSFVKNFNSYPNLEEITLNEGSPSTIKLLLGVVRPLKRLEFGDLVRLNGQEKLKDFELILGKHAKTLEKLQFAVSTSDLQIDESIIVHLPALPRLKELNIEVIREGRRGIECAFFDDLDLSPMVNYSWHLPSIQSLTLKETWDNKPITFSTPFISTEREGRQNACQTLQRLDIQYEDDEGSVISGVAEISALFPNVFNKWLNAARTENTSRAGGRMEIDA